MLDKLSKKILYYMRTDTENPSETYYDFGDDLDEMAEKISSDSESVRAAIRYLEKNEYIKFGYTDSEYAIRFYLDHKGLHRKELLWIEFLEFFQKSILTPIIVAFLTSVITINLWTSLLHWLRTLLLQIQ